MRKVIIDAEFDGLNPSKVWVIVCKDIKSSELFVFAKDNLLDFIPFSKEVSVWVGHNLISFDVPHLNRILNLELDWRKCIDTLIVSRLINYGRLGGHSVECWAKQFGLWKKDIAVYDDPNLIDEYVERCKSDVEIQYRIYKELERFIKDPSWRAALRIEHDVQYICRDMHVNGFAFNKPEADRLLSTITEEMAEIEDQIKQDVPPVLVKGAPITLRVNKDGSPSKKSVESIGVPCRFTDGSTFHRFHYEPFNPGSSQQRIRYLNAIGWKPVDKTKGHIQCERDLAHARSEGERRKLSERLENFRRYGWRCNESNLSTLPADAPRGARLLAKWLTLEGRRGDLEEWNSAFNPATGRVHGSFNGIGAWTHRMSHVRPNKGNIFSNFTLDDCEDTERPTPVEEVKVKYNGLLRGLWQAYPGRVLVGADAEGIQMRILAHYVDNPDFTEAIVNGDKELGTDVHSFNRRLLGEVCRSRAIAKRFIYSWLLGAGPAKIAEILGCSFVEARTAMDNFVRSIPGLAELKRRRIPTDSERGYFVGLDGRKVICRSQHHMLAGYLQNGEAVCVKHATARWRKLADEQGILYKHVDLVHDEFVTEVETEEEAHIVGQAQCKAIEEVGEELGLNCQLAGEYQLGQNWLEVH